MRYEEKEGKRKEERRRENDGNSLHSLGELWA